MDKEELIRKNLLDLFSGENSRMPFDECVRNFPMERINEKYPNGEYSAWALLEHIRLAQEDILDFIKNPDYKYREFPDDYWPPKGKEVTPSDWEETIKSIKSDTEEIENMIRDPQTDLYKLIPWGTGHTFLQEIITVSNHNGFHLGEFAIMRQVMGTWDESHQ